MMKPFFTQEQRLDIKHRSYFGAKLELSLAWEKFKRSVREENNCLVAELIIRYIGNIKIETKYK